MYVFRCKLWMIALLSLVTTGASATDCNGSLGDPIVNVTFGAGSASGPSLSSSTTSNLQYTSTSCPGDGFYSIVNYTSNCFGGDFNWHTVKDHTGNSNGYFMLVNASFQSSDFYIQTINGLCEGTTYRFATWLLNMCRFRGILPNITLSVEKTDGTVLQSYDTGDIPMTGTATWNPYGFLFTTPVGVSTVILHMRNNAPGGTGNDVALDDITFRSVGPAVSIRLNGVAGDSLRLCTKDAGQTQFTSTVESCFPATAYQWQLSTDSGASWKNIPGAVTMQYNRAASGAGSYWYRLAVAPVQNIAATSCRTASSPIMITVLDEPQTALFAKAQICTNDSLLLNPGPFDTYLWQDGSSQPVYIVHKAGVYPVTVTNACGSGRVETTVTERSCEILFPTAFTPNKDGKNDIFKGLNLLSTGTFRLQIYNRWGQKVFETADYTKGWDGTLHGEPAATGMYIWYCEMGNLQGSSRKQLKGTVILIR